MLLGDLDCEFCDMRLGSMMNELPFEVSPLRLTCAAFSTDRAEPTINRTFLRIAFPSITLAALAYRKYSFTLSIDFILENESNLQY